MDPSRPGVAERRFAEYAAQNPTVAQPCPVRQVMATPDGRVSTFNRPA